MPPADKTCRVCGRRFAWRPRWADVWDTPDGVTHCSKACRKQGLRPLDRSLEDALLALVTQRGPHKTACPSEAARAVRPDDWRGLMERTRQAARRLVHRGLVDIVQRSHVVDPSDVRGPIRVRLRPGLRPLLRR
mgnify:CR=1 FL=1